MSYVRRMNVLANHVGAPSGLFSLQVHLAAALIVLFICAAFAVYFEVGTSICSSRKASPVVIGGMVLDIQATPLSHDILPGTTTPGEVCYVRGGVGRNIAECLGKLGAHPFLISVVGDDMAGKILAEHWRSLGLQVNGIRICSGASTPVISAVFDKRGELAAAVADTLAVEVYLTPEWIDNFAREIHSASVVLIDANLDLPAIKLACKMANDANVPVWFEPVSVAKSVRATDMLPLITYISPNEAELVAMANALQPVHPTKHKSTAAANQVQTVNGSLHNSHNGAFALVLQLEDCIGKLLEAGVKYIFLTLGNEGAVLCSRKPRGEIACLHYPALPASVVKLSGAGDSLVAGSVAALSNDIPEVHALAYGVAAAKLTVESVMNVAQNLSWSAIAAEAEKLLLLSQALGITSWRNHLEVEG